MAFIFHGVGAMVYGERDYWPDGSFVTTEFFVFAWVPLVPMISQRISYTKNSDYATYDSSGYYVYELLPLNWKQVLSVYAWFAFLPVPMILDSYLGDAFTKIFGSRDRSAGVMLATTALILITPYLLRRWAKRRKVEEWKRQNLGLHG
jgi:hypothetical protein